MRGAGLPWPSTHVSPRPGCLVLIFRHCHDPQDFVREADPQAELRSLSLKTFAKLMFQKCPSLSQYSDFLDEIYRQFNDYKQVCLRRAARQFANPRYADSAHAYLKLSHVYNIMQGPADGCF